MDTLLRHGSEEQNQKYLPKIAAGELRLQAFGVTEPIAGTDTLSIRTFAEKQGDNYVVNDQKVWISHAKHSDLLLLLARTSPKDQVKRKTDGLSVFLVDIHESGVVAADLAKLGVTGPPEILEGEKWFLCGNMP